MRPSSIYRNLRILIFVVLAISAVPIVHAAPSSQSGDPVAQCKNGIKLFDDNKDNDALPYLEWGFYHRLEANFDNIDELGECAYDLALIRKSYNDLNGALEAYAVALEIYHADGHLEYEGNVLNDMGLIFNDQANYAQALDYHQKSLSIYRAMGNREYEGIALNNIGVVYESTGYYTEALYNYGLSLEISKEYGGSRGQSKSLHNIGTIYYHQGNYGEALDYYQQALNIEMQIGSPEESDTLTSMAIIFDELDESDLSLQYLNRALQISKNLNDLDSRAYVLENIGMAYLSKSQYDNALQYSMQALDIHRQLGNAPVRLLANIGAIYDAQKQYSDAMQYYQQALSLSRETDDRLIEGGMLTMIGGLHELEGNPQEALRDYEQAIEVYESVRSSAGFDITKSTLFSFIPDSYRDAAALYHVQGLDQDAFYVSERGRARSFLDSLVTGHIELSEDDSKELISRELQSYENLQFAKKSLENAKAQSVPDPALVDKLEKQAQQAQQAHQNVIAEIQAQNDRISSIIPGGQAALLDVPQTQALLDKDSTLISFWFTDTHLLAFIISTTSFKTVELDISLEEVNGLIKDFLNFSNLDASSSDTAVNLYTVLIAPIKPYINSKNLIIVPHLVLHYLPFSALTDGDHFLLDDYTISYLPSVSTLTFIHQNAENNKGQQVLILGNPQTGDYDAAASFTTERDQLGPLPFAEEEAKNISDELGIQAYIQADATETLVKQQASQTKVLHLAAHGVFNSVAPLSSLIALAPDEKNDGWLTVGEVYGLDLKNSDLVVLSACETQIGQLTDGDEFVGLTRAFLFAGTPTVASSLWSVDDKATAFLMERFYKYMQDGNGKAEALRQAQIDTREQYPNPYYWAAFVLNGDSGKVAGIKNNELAETQLPTQEPNAGPVRFPNCMAGLSLIFLPLTIVHLSKKR